MRVELRNARRAKGLTQQQLADMVGVERTVYCRIENGGREPTARLACRIAAALGRSVEELFAPQDVLESHANADSVAG